MLPRILVLAVAVVGVSRACDIDEVRYKVYNGPMPREWSRVNSDDETILELQRRAAQFAPSVTKAIQVTESYMFTKTIQATTMYCIRFSAAGDCTLDGYCEGYDCVTNGYHRTQILPSDVRCQKIQVCNLTAVHEIANGTVPTNGASMERNETAHNWTKEEVTVTKVVELYDKAAEIAAASKDSIVEAYSQTHLERGTDYCIVFRSSGSQTCTGTCPLTNCTATGHRLPPGSNVGHFVNIGVHCESQATDGASGLLTSSLTSYMTSVVVGLVVVLATLHL